jgi:hypothetical protein
MERSRIRENFLYDLKRRPAGGRCAAVLGRRTPDGVRTRIATLASCTTSPASGRTSLERVRQVGEQER